MRAGALRHLVTFQTPSTSQDEAGQPTLTWTEHSKAWASILHKSGAETLRGDRDTSIVEASIRVNRRPGIDPSMRVVFGTRVYEIKAVLQDDERLDRLDLVVHRVS